MEEDPAAHEMQLTMYMFQVVITPAMQQVKQVCIAVACAARICTLGN